MCDTEFGDFPPSPASSKMSFFSQHFLDGKYVRIKLPISRSRKLLLHNDVNLLISSRFFYVQCSQRIFFWIISQGDTE